MLKLVFLMSCQIPGPPSLFSLLWWLHPRSLKEDKGGFPHNFPEKQGEETVKTDSAFVSDSQALLNCSCHDILEMYCHFPLFTSVVLPKLRYEFVRDWKSSLHLVPVKCEPQHLPSNVLSPAPVIFLVVAQRKREAAAALLKCHLNKWSL